MKNKMMCMVLCDCVHIYIIPTKILIIGTNSTLEFTSKPKNFTRVYISQQLRGIVIKFLYIYLCIIFSYR